MAAEPSTRRVFWRRLGSGLLIEGWPVVVVVMAVLAALGGMPGTYWERILFDHGDSLVLPLLEQSILDGDPLHVVFSSQLFLFPETPLYAISAAITGSVRWALLVNGVLNVVVLYALFRAIAHQLAHRTRHRVVEIIIALGATLLFVVIVLLERAATVNFSALATPLLTSTYYFGVIASGLAVLALTLWVTRLFVKLPWRRKPVVVYGVSILLLGGLTTFSNPLFAVQVVAPLVAALLLLVFANRLSWPRFFYLVAVNVLALAVGMLLRRVFADLIPAVLSNYVSINQIPTSIGQLNAAIQEMLSTGQGMLKLLILVGMQVVSGVVLVAALYAQSRPRLARSISSSEFFVASFVTVSSISLTAGMLLTGSITTRYLEPLTVFPILTVISLGIYVLRRLLTEVESTVLRANLSRYTLGIVAGGSLLVVVIGAINLPQVIRLGTGGDYTDAACLDKFVGDSPINGVGSFWSARPLELYGAQSGDVLQVDENLEPYRWMINIGAYNDKVFSFVVTDQTGFLPVESLEILGDPREIISCDAYTIYDYQDTPGEKILTDTVEAGTERLER